jgi:hypothetical protein
VGAERGERFAGESYVKREAGQMTDYGFGCCAWHPSGRSGPSGRGGWSDGGLGNGFRYLSSVICHGSSGGVDGVV